MKTKLLKGALDSPSAHSINNIMNISKNSYLDKINGLSARERSIILAATLATLYVMFFHFILPSIEAPRESLKNNIELMQAQISVRSQDVHQLVSMSHQHSDVAKQNRIEKINLQLSNLGDNWAKLSTGLISPHEMPQLIENILTQQSDIEIVRIENLPATPLVKNESAESPAATDIYKHGLYLEIRGQYFDTVQLLRELEALPWQIIWGEFNLRSDSPPSSTISLTLYTLSFGETWLEI